ncbi:MAG: glycosylhydrolase-like jelly roll fold domain-containing protein [Planctomycetota bacterium]
MYGGRRSLWPEPPAGHDYDVLGPKILAKLRVESGTIVTPGGARYRVMILPPEDRATPETMREVARLADAGAAIVGSPPTAAWGLSNQPEADAEVRAIGERLWAAGGGATRGGELAATLQRLGVTPDCLVTGVPSETDTEEPVVWTHRVVGESDVYFIANRTASAIDAKVSLRSSLGVPELWDAESGEAVLAPHWSRDGERTRVDLTLGPHSSRFVVLRGTAAVEAVVADHSAPSLPAPIMITEGWRLTAGDATVDPATLTPWDESDDDAIRHFSGTAEYRVTFGAPGEPIGEGVRATLDLGEVAVIAEATLNGVPLGVAWRAPHRLDATEAFRSGRNELVVRVTNLWVNALIGAERDAGRSAEGHPPNGRLVESLPTEWLDDGSSAGPEPVPIVATGWRHWSAESKLARSGLMGPVKVIFDRAPSGTPAP